jgi:archaellum biogenesis protein FlaJ (TadC family)
MGARIAVMAFVAVVLLVVLILRSPMIPTAVYKFGFFLGLAALAVFLFWRPGGPDMEWMEIGLGRGRIAYASAGLLALIPLSPFVVLIETGIAGYRGFSSFVRYAALSLTVLGLAGLVASLVIPKLIRR